MVRLCQEQQRTDTIVLGSIQEERMKCLHFFVCKLSSPEGGELRGDECVMPFVCKWKISTQKEPQSK